MSDPRSVTGYGVGGDEGRALWFLGGLVMWKAVGADTGGQCGLVEQAGAAGTRGLPPADLVVPDDARIHEIAAKYGTTLL